MAARYGTVNGSPGPFFLATRFKETRKTVRRTVLRGGFLCHGRTGLQARWCLPTRFKKTRENVRENASLRGVIRHVERVSRPAAPHYGWYCRVGRRWRFEVAGSCGSCERGALRGVRVGSLDHPTGKDGPGEPSYGDFLRFCVLFFQRTSRDATKSRARRGSGSRAGDGGYGSRR